MGYIKNRLHLKAVTDKGKKVVDVPDQTGGAYRDRRAVVGTRDPH